MCDTIRVGRSVTRLRPKRPRLSQTMDPGIQDRLNVHGHNFAPDGIGIAIKLPRGTLRQVIGGFGLSRAIRMLALHRLRSPFLAVTVRTDFERDR